MMQQCWKILISWITLTVMHLVPLVRPCVSMGTPLIPIASTCKDPSKNNDWLMLWRTSTVPWAQSVPQLSGCLVMLLDHLNFWISKKNLKIGLSPVGKHYIVSALLRNALTCLYGNNTGAYFGVEPPSLEETSPKYETVELLSWVKVTIRCIFCSLCNNSGSA